MRYLGNVVNTSYTRCTYNVALPVNINSQDYNYFKKLSKISAIGITLECYKNVKVNYEGFIFYKNKIMVSSLIDPNHLNKYLTFKSRFSFIIKNHLIRNTKLLKGRYIWFTDNWSSSYFHWMTEALPRLFSVRMYLNDHIVLLPDSYKSLDYVKETLNIFAIPQLKFVPKNQVFKTQHLLLPTRAAKTSHYHPALLHNFRSYVLKRISQKRISQKRISQKRIFVSRRKCLKRRVLNEDQILPILNRLKFEIIFFEDYTILEQINIMSETKYLVSMHGAGLTNMIFMNTNCNVLELRHGHSCFWDCYFKLSGVFKINYHYLMCEVRALHNSNNEYDSYNHGDLYVNPEKLEDSIKNMLALT